MKNWFKKKNNGSVVGLSEQITDKNIVTIKGIKYVVSITANLEIELKNGHVVIHEYKNECSTYVPKKVDALKLEQLDYTDVEYYIDNCFRIGVIHTFDKTTKKYKSINVSEIKNISYQIKKEVIKEEPYEYESMSDQVPGIGPKIIHSSSI